MMKTKKVLLAFSFVSLMRRNCLFTVMVIGAIILGTIPTNVYASGATYWQGPTGSTADWFSDSNWDNGCPNSSDDAYINNGGIAEIASGAAAANYITFNEGNCILKGGTLSVSDNMEIYSGSTFQHTGGTSNISVLFSDGDYSLSQANADIPSILATDLSIVRNGGIFTQSGGEHRVSQQQHVSSQYTLSGGIHTIDQSLYIYDQGIYRVSGGSLIASNVDVGGNRYEGATLEAAFGGTVSVKDGFFQNNTIRVFEDGLVDLTKGGKVLVGNVDTGLDSTITVGIDGALEGTGAIIGNVSNQGMVRSGLRYIGHQEYSPGTLTITGDYEQELDGTLALFLVGTDAGSFSRLSIDGQAYLTGELNLSLIDGFIPNIGDTFEILNAGACYGNFSLINVIGLPDNMFFDIEYGSNNVVLEVVPEPATIIFFGLSGLLLRKRHRGQ